MNISAICEQYRASVTALHTEPSIGWSVDETFACIVFWTAVHVAARDGERFNKAAAIRELQAGPLSARTRGSIEAKTMNVTAAAEVLGVEPSGIDRAGNPAVCPGYKAAPNRARLIDEMLPGMLSSLGVRLLSEVTV